MADEVIFVSVYQINKMNTNYDFNSKVKIMHSVW